MCVHEEQEDKGAMLQEVQDLLLMDDTTKCSHRWWWMDGCGWWMMDEGGQTDGDNSNDDNCKPTYLLSMVVGIHYLGFY